MTAARKAKPPALRVVANGPDIAEIERFVSDAMRATVPAVTRESLAVENFTTGLRVLENDRAALGEQRSLCERLFNALMASFEAADADLDKAIARYRNGLTDGAGQ